MARSAFERTLIVQTERFSNNNVRKSFIRAARANFEMFLARQQERPAFEILINGRVVASESSFRIGDALSYRLLKLPEVGRYAKRIAREISPPGPTGEYKQAWFLLAHNREVEDDEIPGDVKELILTNDVPYARKIQALGARLQNIPPGIVERVRQYVIRKYGGIVTAHIEYFTLQRGYVLKRSTRRHRAGEELTYPSLVIQSK